MRTRIKWREEERGPQKVQRKLVCKHLHGVSDDAMRPNINTGMGKVASRLE